MPSLADQYLDTMVMDDGWRSACFWQIREGRRLQRLLKRLNNRKSSIGRSDPPKIPAKVVSKPKMKPEPVLDNSSVSHEMDQENGLRYTDSSDSGFYSWSLTSSSSATLRTRSTRSSRNSLTPAPGDRPLQEGRRCLSCKAPDTTCWRHALGGIICNSCGLR